MKFELLASLATHLSSPISQLLRPGELQSVWLSLQQIADGHPLHAESQATIMLELTIVEETFRFFLFDDMVTESQEECSGRLRSDLQDWISESRFAWGEWRK